MSDLIPIDDKELFAEELDFNGEHSLAERVRSGVDNSHRGIALRAMERVRRQELQLVEKELNTRFKRWRENFFQGFLEDPMTDQAVKDLVDEGRHRERKYLKSKLDIRLNNFLVEMSPNCDDSIVGFNEAWDLVRKIFHDS